MADVIKLLPDSVANQIAAGEVIQRPASIVKELVENSVDAGASSITVIVNDGGKTLIQVIDNGCGMSVTDARLAFERHATSKISTAEDLFRIKTMGFRGEALASIAAISQVILRTRQKEDEIGTEVIVEGSKFIDQSPVSCPAGSNFIIKNIFFNVPARRKFLKSHTTELKHIIDEFTRIAIPFNDIEFKLIHNEVLIYSLPPSNVKQRIVHIFGNQMNSNLLPINCETNLIKIKGYIGKPENAKKRYGEQYFFVNKRFIKHNYLHRAVISAYENLLPADNIPSYFLFFEVDPESIDVNIHPTKTEVKFEDEQAIFQILKAAIKETLGKTNIFPAIDFDIDRSIKIPLVVEKNFEEIKVPEISINKHYNPFEQEAIREKIQNREDENLKNWEKLYENLPHNLSIKKESDNQLLSNSSSIINKDFIQVRNKYIITSIKSGVLIINQKRAYERILYEKLLHSLAHNKIITQQMTFPETLDLNEKEFLIFSEIYNDLLEMGFDITIIGKNCISINGYPADIENINTGELIASLIDYYENTKENISKNIKEKFLREIAHKASLGFNKKLIYEEMQHLIDQLFACEEPNYTPNGKKVLYILSIDEIDSLFE